MNYPKLLRKLIRELFQLALKLIFIFIGLIVLVWMDKQIDNHLLNTWSSVEATILDCEIREHYRWNDVIFIDLEYIIQQEGVSYRYEARESVTHRNMCVVNRPITIYYNPKHPSQNFVPDDGALHGVAFAILLAGLSIWIVVWNKLFASRKRSKR